jgi:hypothetical protein
MEKITGSISADLSLGCVITHLIANDAIVGVLLIVALITD